jgi:hypothetical protein
MLGFLPARTKQVLILPNHSFLLFGSLPESFLAVGKVLFGGFGYYFFYYFVYVVF